MVLSPAEIFSRIRALTQDDDLALVMTAGVLTESGGNLQAVGDGGASVGPYQMHSEGRGAGMSVAERMDLEITTRKMLPYYRAGVDKAIDQGVVGDDRAVFTYLEAERPFGYPHLDAPAAQRFRQRWQEVQSLQTPNLNTTGNDQRMASRQAFIDELHKYMAVPYVFGGKNPSGFDCSGFVTYCAKVVGVDLGDPAVTSAESLRQRLNEIPHTSIAPGDLVFFEKTYDTPGASHVGVWLRPGVMIDTHEPGGVQETNLYSDYWQQHWLSVGQLPVPAVTAANPTTPTTNDAAPPAVGPLPTPQPPALTPQDRQWMAAMFEELAQYLRSKS